MEKKFKRTTVTSALPYANGPVHIGHLAGVYVPADIYVRYLRLKKEDVLFIGGSDEHGVPITIRAKKEGVTPQDVVDRYHYLIKKSFEEFGVSFDVYSRTTSKTHHELASDFFKTLYNKGEFIEKTSEQYYDEEAKTFLADRYITGECPHCHSEGAYGDQCEKCGTSLSPTDLINPKSAISGSKPVMKETKHWYLPLDKHEGWLRQWILEDHKEWRPNVYGQCKSWLDMGLQPRAVSRDLDWGIPVPVEGAEGKVLYVWFDAPIGYISNTKELLPDSWETWWKDPETRLLHFIGKDNIVFHCIVFPAMLKAEGSYILPDNVPSNEFLNLEGDKISTSRNWAVWLHEYLEDFPGKQDVLRYVLTANAPETKDNDFTWKDFQARNNNELVAVYGNFVNRAMVLTQKYFDSKVRRTDGLRQRNPERICRRKGRSRKAARRIQISRRAERGDEPGTHRQQIPCRHRTLETGKDRHGTCRHHPEHLSATGCQPCHRFRTVPAFQLGETSQDAEHGKLRMVGTGKERSAPGRTSAEQAGTAVRKNRRQRNRGTGTEVARHEEGQRRSQL